MTPKQADVERIFTAAVEMDDSRQRASFLDAACGQDPDLRAEVESLLKHDEEAVSFIERPAVASPGTIAYQPITEVPGTTIGPYKLLQKIGEGGFGVVYMAEQQHPVRRKAALKIIKAGMDTREVIARFESERQALALMDHPNIAKVLDAGATESGRPYFVMELVKGVPITAFCDSNHMPAEQRLKLFMDVCHAIQHAHHKGVIHRDVKPSNVMVTLHDGMPVVKVIDFGVAKATSQSLTEKTLFTAYGQMVGTPAYMSPEQAEMSGLDIDTRSDIYSLGVLLYELLTGTTPLDMQRLRTAGFAEMQRLIREEEAPRPSNRLSSLGASATVLAGNRGTDPRQLVRLLAGDLDWIVMKALDKDRNRRYDTPGTFAEDVRRYLLREAIVARPPSALYHLRKFAQRNRAAVLTGAAIVLALVSGTAVASWQAVRATRAKQVARDAAAEAAAKEAETKAVLDFVETQIIGVARPDGQQGGLGRNVTLRQALEAALPYVEQNFKDQPLTEARLRTTLGQSFRYLGDAKVALQQLERAHALNTQHRPDAHETLVCMNWLCQVYQHLGRGDEGLKLSEETVERMNAKLGPNHRDTLRATSTLAKLYYTVRRHEDARKLHEETLARQTAAFGPDDDDTLLTRMDLDSDLDRLGRYEEALHSREETLGRMIAKYGEGHPNTLNAMGGVGYMYYRFGRHDEALKLREKCLAFLRDKFPPDHPSAIAGMRTLADSYAHANRQTDALRLREEALALERANLGKDDSKTLESAAKLADNYVALNQHEKAIELSQEILEILKKKLGRDDPATLRSMARLASIYDKAGRRPDSQKLYATVIERQKATLGPDHKDTLDSMWAFSLTRDKEDQVKICQEGLDLVQAKLGPDHEETLRWMRRVALSLEKVDRGSELLALCDDYLRRVGERPANLDGFHAIVFVRIKHFARRGDPEGCKATAEIWEKLNRTDIYGCYNAAGLRAITGAVIRKTDMTEQGAQQADAEADRAMDWLRKCAALGFKDFAHMEKATDFESLRGREDFKKLVDELKGAAENVAATSK